MTADTMNLSSPANQGTALVRDRWILGLLTALTAALAAAATGAFGSGNMPVAAGATLDLSSLSITGGAISDNSTLALLSTTGTSPFSTVAFGSNPLTEVVGSMTIDGAAQPPGSYNAVNLPDYITGSGSIVVVVPEPASLCVIALGAVGLRARRRRR